MVDEASQERTFRAAVVHTHLVWQERLSQYFIDYFEYFNRGLKRIP
jgi:hypothetical protein